MSWGATGNSSRHFLELFAAFWTGLVGSHLKSASILALYGPAQHKFTHTSHLLTSVTWTWKCFIISSVYFVLSSTHFPPFSVCKEIARGGFFVPLLFKTCWRWCASFIPLASHSQYETPPTCSRGRMSLFAVSSHPLVGRRRKNLLLEEPGVLPSL